MDWHGYVLISGLPTSLTAKNRETIWTDLEKMGPQVSKHPQFNNQSRRSIDGRQLILEAKFNLDNITKQKFIDRIAAKMGISTVIVESSLVITPFVLKGTWEESRQACAAFISKNSTKWEILA